MDTSISMDKAYVDSTGNGVKWAYFANLGLLYYQRKDTQKRFEKSAGDYGLIGGRANQNDMPIADKAALLKELQSPNSGLIKKALPETLKRELREEAGLLFEAHYTFKPWHRLKPYRQVQGAAPNHALTEYYLEIFRIDLTLEGYLFLQQKIKSDDLFAWFSIDEMVRGETTDGKIPYIGFWFIIMLNFKVNLRFSKRARKTNGWNYSA